MPSDFEAAEMAQRAHENLYIRYAYALDDRDWPALAALFTEDATFGAKRFLGYGNGYTSANYFEGRDGIVASIGGIIETLSATHHLTSSYVVNVGADGQTAKASCYFRAWHGGRDDRADLFEESLGRFDLETVRVGSEWLIQNMFETIMVMLGTAYAFGTPAGL